MNGRTLVYDFDAHQFDLLLTDSNISSKEFAELTGFSYYTVAAWRRGSKLPSAKAFNVICDSLDVIPASLHRCISAKNEEPVEHVSSRHIRPGDVFTIKLDNGSMPQLLVFNIITENCVSGVYLTPERRHSTWTELYTNAPMYVNSGKIGIVLISRLADHICSISDDELNEVRRQCLSLIIPEDFEFEEEPVDESEVPVGTYSRLSMSFDSIGNWHELFSELSKYPFPAQPSDICVDITKSK